MFRDRRRGPVWFLPWHSSLPLTLSWFGGIIFARGFLMSMQRRVSSVVFLTAMAGAVCSAQSITSAHSGTLHYFEGDVSIDGAQVQPKVGKFQEIKVQSVLSTALGRAEVLLTPGVFLRLGENSSIRMIDNRLVSTRVDVLSGNVILESDDPQMDLKDSPVVLLYKNYEIRMRNN